VKRKRPGSLEYAVRIYFSGGDESKSTNKEVRFRAALSDNESKLSLAIV
jgi:hypothetical protein